MDELCGNIEKYKDIYKWINTTVNNIKKTDKISLNNCLFISGNTGIGKTYSIKKICEISDLFVTYITSTNCSTSEQLTDLIVKTSSSSLIQLLTNNTQKKIIIVDEFECIMSMDRTINVALFNILSSEKIKAIPIICLCSPDIIKKIGIIKKKCKIIELDIPSADSIYLFLQKNYSTVPESKLKEISIISNGNISQAIKKIEEANNNDGLIIKNTDVIDEIYNIEHLYGTSNDIFNREIILKIIMAYSWLIPLRYHENLIKELKNRKSTIIKTNNFYNEFIKNFITFDLLMYNNNTNGDIAANYFTSMTYPLYQMLKKKDVKSNIENFTKILSYLSLQKKYIKKSYSPNYPLYQFGNYHINTLGRNFIFFN